MPAGFRRKASGDGKNREEADRAGRDRHSSPQTLRLASDVSAGFTLLEVMVAVALLGLVLVSLLGLKNRTMQDVMLADHITTATLLAKREMTEMLQNPQSRPQESETEDKFQEEEFKDYTWKKTFAPQTIETQNGPITITEIKVAVLWKEGNRDESVELVSYE